METSDKISWTPRAVIEQNNDVLRYIPFSSSIQVAAVRINVTASAMDVPASGWTRIAEVIPGLFVGQERFPADFVARASSSHAPNIGSNGKQRCYDPGLAIDGDTDSFWNDDTENQTPDSLSITSTNPIVIPGVTLISTSDGFPEDLVVYTYINADAGWIPQANVTANNLSNFSIPFPNGPVSAMGVNITVTRNRVPAAGGNFTRISEVKPIIPDTMAIPVKSNYSLPGTSFSSPSSSSSPSAPIFSITPSSSTLATLSTTTSNRKEIQSPTRMASQLFTPTSSGDHAAKNNVGATAGGIVGGVAGATLIAAAVFVFLVRRKRKHTAAADISYPMRGSHRVDNEPSRFPRSNR